MWITCIFLIHFWVSFHTVRTLFIDRVNPCDVLKNVSDISGPLKYIMRDGKRVGIAMGEFYECFLFCPKPVGLFMLFLSGIQKSTFAPSVATSIYLRQCCITGRRSTVGEVAFFSWGQSLKKRLNEMSPAAKTPASGNVSVLKGIAQQHTKTRINNRPNFQIPRFYLMSLTSGIISISLFFCHH